MRVHFTIALSIIVSVSNVDAFSLNSYLGYSGGSFKVSSIRRPSGGLNDRTALHIWKSKEEEQTTVVVESKREQEAPSVKIIDKFPSLGKLGDFNKFLRAETDDIWEEELSVAADQETTNNNVSEESQNLASFVAVGALATIALVFGSQYLSVDSKYVSSCFVLFVTNKHVSSKVW